METITLSKKEYDKRKNVTGIDSSDQERKEWKATVEILQNKDLMDQIRESEKNIKQGKIWKSKY